MNEHRQRPLRPDEPLRIMYLIDHLGIGGAERMLSGYLSQASRDELEARVVVLDPSVPNPIASEITQSGIPVDFVPVRRLRDPRAIPRLVGHIRRWKPDLVHNQLQWAIVLGGVAARLTGTPAIATLHTMHSEARRTRDRLRSAAATLALRNAHDAVIAVSDAGRRAHVKDLGLDEGAVRTIYNGVDVDAFRRARETRAEMRRELGLAPLDRVILSVAVLRRGKGMEDLIAAVPRIAAAIPAVRVLIAGDGPERRGLERLASDTGVADRIRFLGHRDDIASVLSTADVFVLPSHYEVLPTVIAEAMAAETPIVASSVGGIPEMVEDGTSGILIPPTDAVALAEACIRVLDDPTLSARLAAEGTVSVRSRFDIGKQLSTTLDLYREVIGRRRHTDASIPADG